VNCSHDLTSGTIPFSRLMALGTRALRSFYLDANLRSFGNSGEKDFVRGAERVLEMPASQEAPLRSSAWIFPLELTFSCDRVKNRA